MSTTLRNSLDELETPALILDRRRLDANLLRMREHVARLGVSLRPHMKTAKSAEVARRALPQGGGITVSTLREAEYFFGHGYHDLFYAVGASPQKLDRAAALMRRGARLLLALDQPEAARAIAERGSALGLAFEVMIEIDCGDGRCGLDAQSSALLEVAAELRKNIDQTVSSLLSQLDVNVREIVRDAVAEKLKQPRDPSS
ncbi:MAG: alanine racemase [Betaproteobacteria bacterium]|nr:alanine racemase [Betaproteobacteria bacterium]